MLHSFEKQQIWVDENENCHWTRIWGCCRLGLLKCHLLSRLDVYVGYCVSYLLCSSSTDTVLSLDVFRKGSLFASCAKVSNEHASNTIDTDGNNKSTHGHLKPTPKPHELMYQWNIMKPHSWCVCACVFSGQVSACVGHGQWHWSGTMCGSGLKPC